MDGTEGFRLRDGSLLSERLAAPAAHWHVQSGLAGYGPDGADGTAVFESLGEALEYARDELAAFIDMADESAHGFADAGQYEEAWREVERIEALELLRANLSPSRRSAPLYVNDTAAYAALQESQAAGFPVDVSDNARLYLWDCSNDECLEEDQ